MQAVFLDFDTVSYGDEIPLTPIREVVSELAVYPHSAPGEIAGRVRDCQVLLTNKCRITGEVMDAAPDLKLICLAATGFDNVDLEAARERDIAVCNIVAYATPSVVQHCFALMLALNQHLDAYRARVSEGDWEQNPHFTMLDYPFHELAARRLGIVGYGELGQNVARVAEAFGMQVLIAERPGHKPRSGRRPLEEVLAEADILSLHCPLTDETRHLIDARALERMPEHALLINTARGAVVDEAALADALRQGRIAGAGVDVLSQEPPVDGNPLLASDIPNLIVTPHVAWAGVEARQRAVSEMAANVRAFAQGKRRNRVD